MPARKKPTTRDAKPAKQSIVPCLWFDGQAEAAAKFYTSLFPGSRIDTVVTAPADSPSGKKGDVLSVDFTLMGQKFSGLNGDRTSSSTKPSRSRSRARTRRRWIGTGRPCQPSRRPNSAAG